MTTYTIHLENMEFYAYHGCYAQEKVIGGRFRVDMTLEADLAVAAATDDISKTISYLDVFGIVGEQMAVKSDIIEHVARRIVDAVRARFPQIVHISVKVSKMAPPLGGKLERVAVTLSE
ncbi:MAG: dihydroneopterin aldolase [Rikenellaceae bacterium]|nr:dihydroneopterin aldolase [Rikenellaceae bacterium]